MVAVNVRDNDVEKALRQLKKVSNREGIFRELRSRREREKPYEKRARKKREGVRRVRKADWKRNSEL